MIKDNRKDEKQNKLNSNLDEFLKTNKPKCEGDECVIEDEIELVQREHKKLITKDGRELLSEYVR